MRATPPCGPGTPSPMPRWKNVDPEDGSPATIVDGGFRPASARSPWCETKRNAKPRRGIRSERGSQVAVRDVVHAQAGNGMEVGCGRVDVRGGRFRLLDDVVGEGAAEVSAERERTEGQACCLNCDHWSSLGYCCIATGWLEEDSPQTDWSHYCEGWTLRRNGYRLRPGARRPMRGGRAER